MDQYDQQLRDPENANKPVVIAPIPQGSLASINSVDQIEAQMNRAEEVKAEAASDPTYNALVNRQEMQFMQNPRGRRDPSLKLSAMLAVGDTVYHKKHKKEAKVREIGRDGRI